MVFHDELMDTFRLVECSDGVKSLQLECVNHIYIIRYVSLVTFI